MMRGAVFSLNIRIAVNVMPETMWMGGSLCLLAVVLGFVDNGKFVAHPELTESSGLAVSEDSSLVFSHNDSGDRARIFVFDRNGASKGQFNLAGADAIDWEDMCAFEIGSTRYLAVGDVGDNTARRS